MRIVLNTNSANTQHSLGHHPNYNDDDDDDDEKRTTIYTYPKLVPKNKTNIHRHSALAIASTRTRNAENLSYRKTQRITISSNVRVQRFFLVSICTDSYRISITLSLRWAAMIRYRFHGACTHNFSKTTFFIPFYFKPFLRPSSSCRIHLCVYTFYRFRYVSFPFSSIWMYLLHAFTKQTYYDMGTILLIRHYMMNQITKISSLHQGNRIFHL